MYFAPSFYLFCIKNNGKNTLRKNLNADSDKKLILYTRLCVSSRFTRERTNSKCSSRIFWGTSNTIHLVYKINETYISTSMALWWCIISDVFICLKCILYSLKVQLKIFCYAFIIWSMTQTTVFKMSKITNKQKLLWDKAYIIILFP